MRLHTGVHLLVCDAGKALILNNHGDEDIIDLRVIAVVTQDNPPAREHVTDRSGRFHTPAGNYAATEPADRHEAMEETFLEDTANRFREIVSAAERHEVVIIADPRSLGRLRPHLEKTPGLTVLAEIVADLAHAPVPEIERAVTAYLFTHGH